MLVVRLFFGPGSVPLGFTQEMMERTVGISSSGPIYLPAKTKVAVAMKPTISGDSSLAPVVFLVLEHDCVVFLCLVWLECDGRLKEMRSRIYCGGISVQQDPISPPPFIV